MMTLIPVRPNRDGRPVACPCGGLHIHWTGIRPDRSQTWSCWACGTGLVTPPLAVTT